MIPTGYKDLGNEEEDERIRQIGEAASLGRTVAFVTDDEDGKLDRYLSKLFTRFPTLVLVTRLKGPVAGTVTAKVRRGP